MKIRIELEDGEVLPEGFARYLLASGESFERKWKKPVPPIHLILSKGGKSFEMEGGFWMEVT